MDPIVFLFVLIALALGVALGLAAFGRAAGVRERDWRDRATRALAELGAASLRAQQADAAERRFAEADARRQEAERRLHGVEAGLAEREKAFAAQLVERDKNFAAQLDQLGAAKEALSAQFSEVGATLLEAAQRQFLDRADQRFAQAGEAGEAKLRALLTPVEGTLKRYEEGLARVEKERIESYSGLREAVVQLTQGNEVVRRETARLTAVMRSSPKARGRWGEEQLRTILEQAGLAENVDFALQSTVSDGERQLRPDCVIHLPGGRCIVVDVKCPLVHFEAAFDEEDEGVRAGLLLNHANAMRSYANDLGRKGYWRQFDLSPDFTIMFIPGEHFLSAAAERAPDLIEGAFRQGVIISSTINMLALSKVMAGMWRQETMASQAREIAEVGKELYKRLAVMGGHVAKVGRNLSLASGAYNDMVGSLESQVMTQARRFEALKVDGGGKPIEPLPLVEATVRPLAKLAVVEGGGPVAETG